MKELDVDSIPSQRLFILQIKLVKAQRHKIRRTNQESNATKYDMNQV